MISKFTRDIIQSEIADFFAGVVEIHTELGGPNTVEEAQNQLTERVLACVPAVDSEPVAWLLSGWGTKNVVCFDSGNAYADPLREVTPLYRHARSSPTGGEVMHRLTFVVEFEDGKEPPVHAHMEVLGGKIVAVAFRDALEEPEKAQGVKTLRKK